MYCGWCTCGRQDDCPEKKFCVNINFIYDYYRKKIPKFYYNKFSQECLIKGFCLATYILKMCQNLTKVIIWFLEKQTNLHLL